MTLSARRRVELAMVSAMLYRCAAIAFARDADTREGQQMPPDNARCLDLLRIAAHEPIADPDPVVSARLARRADRASRDALAPYEQRPMAVVFSLVLYWLDSELRTGRLELIEGSPAAEAIQSLIDMLSGEHPDLMAAVERSARKQVPRFRAHLARLGYFTDTIERSAA